MTTEIEVFNPRTQITQGTAALNELRKIIATRPDKLVINNKQYLFYTDWQLLAAFFSLQKPEKLSEEQLSEHDDMIFKAGQKDIIRFIPEIALMLLSDNEEWQAKLKEIGL